MGTTPNDSMHSLSPAPAADDPILDEWFPVAAAADLHPGSMLSVMLLGRRLLLLCAVDGSVTAVDDTCPHRGAQLSLGAFDGSRLRCPYHGWEFDAAGACVHRPAHPGLEIPAGCHLPGIRLQRALELWWACLGSSPRPLPRYRPHGAYPGQSIVYGPVRLEATGPRIVENFLDVAHFAFVHEGYLGEVGHAEFHDHVVETVDGELWARDVIAWQPKAGPDTQHGCTVHYDYAVDHPYAAMLTKVPAGRTSTDRTSADDTSTDDTSTDDTNTDDTGCFSLLIVAAPETEAACQVYMVTTAHDAGADLQSYNDFQAIIFGQDVAVVESQRPQRLPLDPGHEAHQRADRMSLAYRRWLVDRGVRFGTSANA